MDRNAPLHRPRERQAAHCFAGPSCCAGSGTAPGEAEDIALHGDRLLADGDASAAGETRGNALVIVTELRLPPITAVREKLTSPGAAPDVPQFEIDHSREIPSPPATARVGGSLRGGAAGAATAADRRCL